LRATGSSTSGSGSSEIAVSNGERPVTYWRYWMAMKKKPNAAKNWTVMVSVPALKPRSRNSAGSSIGAATRDSQPTNATVARTPTTSDPTTSGSAQPRSAPSMIPNTVAATATSESRAPGMSSAGGSSSADCGTTARTPISATAARPTLSPKNDCHGKYSSRNPVANKPRTAPPPAMPTQMPMARGRSCSGNDVVMTDSVVGMMAAAPTPISARIRISVAGSFVSIPSPAAAPNSTRPAASSSFRPNRSPSAPANRSRPANTTVYASTIHVTSVWLAPVSRARLGRATLRPLTADTTAMSERPTTASTGRVLLSETVGASDPGLARSVIDVLTHLLFVIEEILFSDGRYSKEGIGVVARARGRPSGGDSGTRDAILTEARRQFGELGYRATTLRAVGRAANVDPRLVLHYFGSKQERSSRRRSCPSAPTKSPRASSVDRERRWAPARRRS
jgi:hypothetical protein